MSTLQGRSDGEREGVEERGKWRRGLAEGVVDEGVVDSGGLGEQAGQHAHQWWDGGAVLVH